MYLTNSYKKRGEELSKARKKSLSSITDFSKGIQTIQSNQAGTEFSQHVLKEISETEHQQYTYYTTHNLVMFWTGPLKGLGLIAPLLTGLLLLPSTTPVSDNTHRHDDGFYESNLTFATIIRNDL